MDTSDQRKFLALAERNGCTIVQGRKHIKVYAADGRYLISLKHGTTGYSGRGDKAPQVAKREGWV